MPIASHVRADVRRRRAAALISALLLVAPLSLPALAAPPTSVETAAQEIAEIATVTGATLHVRTFRPAGKGSFPLAIVNHGSPVNASQRQAMEIPVFPPVSNWLLGRGYAVALPLRRGYGQTGGLWFENYGSCANPDYYRAGLASADDIAAVMTSFRARSDIERDRTLLVGWSAGGWGSIATISRSPIGVVAVLNFAGGRGGNPAVGNCAPERLIAAAGRYGATARIPSAWVYAANDRFFDAALSRKMFDAYVGAGGRAEYVALAAFGSDGHRVFPAADGRALWQPPVEKFLAAVRP
jgi:dienelactone hydrolase